MANSFIVEGAICMCRYGASPGKLCVNSNKFIFLNGGSAMATTLEIGNTFQPPAFGTCNMGQNKPCNPAIIKWSNPFTGMILPKGAQALTMESKATCALAGSECIEIKMNGQIEVPGVPQAKAATAEHQGDMDPVGEPPAADLPDTLRLRI